MTDELAKHFTWDHDPGFLEFMRRADKVVRRAGGMGVLDFADACWADLYEELGAECDDQAILDTLADADDIFAMIIAEG
jgi:hypothetical protein